MSKDEDDSLAAFASENPRNRGKAWLTTLPEWPEIEAAFKNGVDVGTITKWLIQKKGYSPHEVTRGKFQVIYQMRLRDE